MLVSWDGEALSAFENAMARISEDSYLAAIKVASGIELALSDAARHPMRNPPDKYRRDKDTSFRAFELYNYRITYHIHLEELVIVKFRHVKQAPGYY